MNPEKIFISHGKNHTAVYRTVVKWLDDEMKQNADFSWIDYSLPYECLFTGPDNIPADNHEENFCRDKIEKRIRDAVIYIAVSDTYEENKKFMDFEIKTAKNYGKYIIGLKAWRNLIPVPKIILKSADRMISLCSSDLLNAVRDCSNAVRL